MEEINIDNDNGTHTSMSIDNNVRTSLSPINISNDSNIGLDLLMNKSKTNDSQGGQTREVQMTHANPTQEEYVKKSEFDLDNLLNNTASNSNNVSEVKLDNIEEVKLEDNVFSLNNNSETVNINKLDDINSTSTGKTFFEPPPQKTYEELQKEKFDLLCNLERLETRGFRISKTFTMESDFDEMKREYDRIVRKVEVDKSVKFQRKLLIAFVTGIEFLNNKFDPANLKLDGWSESVHENVNDYDDIFEELHEKYKETAQMAPELRLLITLIGSGFMFHLTQSIFKTSLPGFGDIMKQNPDLMNQFAKAAAGSMGSENSGLGNLMGDFVGNKNTPEPNSRTEMRGPPDIGDILSKIDTRKNTRVELDNVSSVSESDIEQIRNINLNRHRKKNSNKNEISLEI
jgi:hypothetical protein